MTNIINKINCHKCISLFVTHDPRRRWGCMYFGFKTNFMPSSEVRKITGTECAYFINKSNIYKLILKTVQENMLVTGFEVNRYVSKNDNF